MYYLIDDKNSRITENGVYLGMAKKYEEYINSPYRINGIEERNFTTRADEELTVNPETGVYYTMRKIAKDKTILHDGFVYTKIFQDSMDKLIDLSHPALKIVVYAMCTVKPLSEIVVLNTPDIAIACNIAVSTAYNAVYELLDKKVISKKLGSSIEFWFDPNVFFNGNRVRVVKCS